jgi:spermidine synthase
MPSTGQDFNIYQGAVEVIEIAVTDSTGGLVDLSTFDSLCWILSKDGTEILREPSTELDIINIDGTDDGVRVTLYSSETSELCLGKLYEHQLWGTLSTEARPISVGDVTVLRGDGC